MVKFYQNKAMLKPRFYSKVIERPGRYQYVTYYRVAKSIIFSNSIIKLIKI